MSTEYTFHIVFVRKKSEVPKALSRAGGYT
jgi:hypothetical protein